jgi:hypothetical protein
MTEQSAVVERPEVQRKRALQSRVRELDDAMAKHARLGEVQRMEWQKKQADLLRQWNCALEELARL